MFCISHLTVSLTCFNNFKTDSKKMKKYFHDRDNKYCMEYTCHQFPDLYIIYIAEYILVIYCVKN